MPAGYAGQAKRCWPRASRTKSNTASSTPAASNAGFSKAASRSAIDGVRQRVLRSTGSSSDISQRKYNEMRIEGAAGRAKRDGARQRHGRHHAHVRDRRILSTNSRFDTLFGYAEGDLDGRLDRGAVSDRVEEYEHAAAIGQQPLPGAPSARISPTSCLFRRRDGSLFWCLRERPRTRPRNGRTTAASGCIADVSERRQAEETLRLSATVLEHIADGVMVIDLHGEVSSPSIAAFTEDHRPHREARRSATESNLTAVRTYLDEADRAFTKRCGPTSPRPGSGAAKSGMRRKNGAAYLESLTVSAVRDDRRRHLRTTSAYSATSPRSKESQDKLDHLAHHDRAHRPAEPAAVPRPPATRDGTRARAQRPAARRDVHRPRSF